MKFAVLAVAMSLAGAAAYANEAAYDDLSVAVAAGEKAALKAALAPDSVYLPADPKSDILKGREAISTHLATAKAALAFKRTKRLIDGGVVVESGYVKRNDTAAKFIAVSTKDKFGRWALNAYAENPVELARFESAQTTAAMAAQTKGAKPQTQALDDVYARMAKAYRTLDADLLKTVYTPDAVYISRSRRAPVESAHKDFVPGVKRFLDASKADDTKLDLAFRLTSRKVLTPGLVVDAGYVEFVVVPGDGKPERRTTAKFLTVLAKQADGTWAFMADTASDTPAEIWAAAKAKGEGRVIGA